MRSDAIEDRRYCRVCGAAELASADRCEECGTSLRPTPSGESIGDLVSLLNTIHQWRREGVLTGRAFLRVRFELERRMAVRRRR